MFTHFKSILLIGILVFKLYLSGGFALVSLLTTWEGIVTVAPEPCVKDVMLILHSDDCVLSDIDVIDGGGTISGVKCSSKSVCGFGSSTGVGFLGGSEAGFTSADCFSSAVVSLGRIVGKGTKSFVGGSFCTNGA